jgi:hypothetical protein
MVLCLTDRLVSYPRNFAHIKWNEFYLWDGGVPDYEELPYLTDNLMRRLDKKHEFKARRLNLYWKTDKAAYYCSHLLA